MKVGTELDEAMIRVDVKTLNRIIADDYTEIGDGGLVETKEKIISEIKSGVWVVSAASSDELHVRLYGKNAGVMIGRWTVKQRYKDKDMSGQFRFTTTWIYRKGNWQLVANHWSKIEEK